MTVTARPGKTSSAPGGTTGAGAATELAQPDVVDLLTSQTQVLRLTASGAPLRTILDAITATLERLLPASHCSILVLDQASGTLRHGSAPTLPGHYLDAIDGLVPAPTAGSCGSAAYLRRTVIVPDIDLDERWKDYRHAAHAAGLRACWSAPILGDHDRVLGTFAVYHDQPREPTDRERTILDQLNDLASVAIEHDVMIAAVTESEEGFRRAFEDNAVAMALLDIDGTCTRVNDALPKLTGRPAAETIGQPLTRLITAEHSSRVLAALAAVTSGESRCELLESRISRPDGTEAVVSMTMSLVRGAAGRPVQVSINMLDVTERHAAEAERRARREAELASRTAEAASRAKTEFLSAVSHEMRTPLQAITGFAEIMRTLTLDDQRRQEALNHITAGASHLLALVDDTLDLARIEAEALPLHPKPVDIAALVEETAAFLTPLADNYAVSLSHRGTHATAWVDRRRTSQVLINLMSNAVRYSGPGKSVHVTVSAHDGKVDIDIADNGPGIPHHVLTNLFTPFARGDQLQVGAPVGEQQGIGLGLMLARGLTDAMGGSLHLTSHPSAGTTATVSLPANPPG